MEVGSRRPRRRLRRGGRSGRGLRCSNRRRLFGVGRLVARVAGLPFVLPDPPSGPGDGRYPGDDAEQGQPDEDERKRAGHAGKGSFSTFWLTTCEDPPGAIVTP